MKQLALLALALVLTACGVAAAPGPAPSATIIRGHVPGWDGAGTYVHAHAAGTGTVCYRDGTCRLELEEELLTTRVEADGTFRFDLPADPAFAEQIELCEIAELRVGFIAGFTLSDSPDVVTQADVIQRFRYGSRDQATYWYFVGEPFEHEGACAHQQVDLDLEPGWNLMTAGADSVRMGVMPDARWITYTLPD